MIQQAIKRTRAVLLLLVGAFFIFWACRPADEGGDSIVYIDVAMSNSYNQSGDEVFHVDTSDYVNLTYTLYNLGGQDVYFVFSNTSTTDSVSNPTVESQGGSGGSQSMGGTSKTVSEPPAGALPVMGKPEISEFNRNPSAYIATGGKTLPKGGEDGGGPLLSGTWNVGDSRSFYDDKGASLTAYCRKEVEGVDTPYVNKDLYIWVEETKWWEYDPPGPITQAMVDDMAIRFLKTGATPDNDIYDWVSNVYGEEWGPPKPGHVWSGLFIDPINEIDILLFDIDGDGIPLSGQGRVLGFFYARDNFKVGAIAYTNARIMFYLDAPLYAYPEGGSWDPTDYWPSYIISTLAHEFQHMIHFYQKAVKFRTDGVNSDTWINEMCSMVAEDLTSDKLGLKGPRGVDPAWNGDDGSAGPINNQYGRLPLYNYYNDISLTDWGHAGALPSYSIAYAFGAYLSRNFGGAPFFRGIVQSPYDDETSIGVLLAGYGETFSTALRKWGAAVLLSDNLSPPPSYQRFNKNVPNGWFQSTWGGIPYNLGSINLYNYRDSGSGLTEPWVWTGSPVGYPGGQFKASNLYYQAGLAMAPGPHTWTIRMEREQRLTVVVKE